MIAEPDVPLTPVDQLDRVFNTVAGLYQALLVIRPVGMPDDITSEAFDRFINSIDALSRIANEQASQHERDSRIRVREARNRAVDAARLATTTSTTSTATEIIAPPPAPNRQVRQRRRPARKSIALKKTELDVAMPDNCSICIDGYTKVNSVTTSCGHAFCKECYNTHEQTVLANHNRVYCPLCRAVNLKITEYRKRGRGNVVPPNPLG
jgi:hypothetical protein